VPSAGVLPVPFATEESPIRPRETSPMVIGTLIGAATPVPPRMPSESPEPTSAVGAPEPDAVPEPPVTDESPIRPS
jgi:hypothetical protein